MPLRIGNSSKNNDSQGKKSRHETVFHQEFKGIWGRRRFQAKIYGFDPAEYNVITEISTDFTFFRQTILTNVVYCCIIYKSRQKSKYFGRCR